MAKLLAALATHEQIKEVLQGPGPQDLHRPAASAIDGDEHGLPTPFMFGTT
jgi:hypothetical protein